MKSIFLKALLILLTFSSYTTKVSKVEKDLGKCTFVLVNETWDNGIYVTVKAGNQSDCNQRPDYNTYLIQKGNSVDVSVDTDICWRREADPSRRTTPPTYQASWNNETCFASGGTKRIVVR